MKQYYKFDVILVLVKRKKYIDAIRIAWLVFLSKLVPGRRLIYRQDAATLAQKSDDDFRVMCVSSAKECKVKLAEILSDKRSLKFNLDEYTADGRLLWIGLKDKIVASVACTSRAEIKNYFFVLKENDVVISRCETHPDYRGNGLYTKSLQMIINELSKEGIQSFYIDCFEWNWPSRRGIEKAGFKIIGYGWDKKGKLTFKPL